jgi:hypothetical protein
LALFPCLSFTLACGILSTYIGPVSMSK